MTTIQAVYSGGVLRPVRALALEEGESVELMLTERKPKQEPVNEMEVLKRMHATTSLEELFALYETLPPPDDDYDLCKALNDNRKAEGRPPVYPNLEDGVQS